MDKMLVAVFETESSAFEGLDALRDLHGSGDITLYASAVVVKDKAGKFDVRQTADEGPVGTAVGLVTGSLIGILGGPAGLALGASLGGLTGMLFDLDSSGVGAGFLDEVSKALSPGKAAVLAEIEESWTTPVDTRLHKLGGVILRRLRSEVVEDQLVRESAAFEADLKTLQDDLKHADAENRAAIQKNIDQGGTCRLTTCRCRPQRRSGRPPQTTGARLLAHARLVLEPLNARPLQASRGVRQRH